jgi:hypothetical protein
MGMLAGLAGCAVAGLLVFMGAALVVGRVRASQAVAAPVIGRGPFPLFPGMRVGPLQTHVVASVHAPIGAIGLLLLLAGIVVLIVTVSVRRPWNNAGRWSGRGHDHDQTAEGHFS